MTYSNATDSYEAELLENILDTDFRYGIPYKIDREKYEMVMKTFNKEIRIKNADVVVFHADYTESGGHGWCTDDKSNEFNYTFYAWPKNSPEGSDDFYDCSLFWDFDYDYKQKETFDRFVHAILETVIEVDYEYLTELKNDLIREKNNIEEQIETITKMYSKFD